VCVCVHVLYNWRVDVSGWGGVPHLSWAVSVSSCTLYVSHAIVAVTLACTWNESWAVPFLLLLWYAAMATAPDMQLKPQRLRQAACLHNWLAGVTRRQLVGPAASLRMLQSPQVVQPYQKLVLFDHVICCGQRVDIMVVGAEYEAGMWLHLLLQPPCRQDMCVLGIRVPWKCAIVSPVCGGGRGWLASISLVACIRAAVVP
jgi:hypothetical protein